MPELLEFTLHALTANELAIKIKNTSSTSLDKTLVIEIYPPMSLVSAAVNEAAVKAADNEDPPGAMRLDGIVTGPEGWSIWARRESSDSSLIIVLMNNRKQDTGVAFKPPIVFSAGAESIVRIPLNPQANRDNTDVLYSYTHGDPEARIDGKLELKSDQKNDSPPDVTLTTDATNPTMVKAGDLVKVMWEIKDGVNATLRGPLPGDNSELALSSSASADFKIAEGSLTVRVVGLMNYVLQAEVKRPNDQPNVQVVKMLTLDTSNKKHLYLGPRQAKVLPHGVIEMDWAAWGVPQVEITAGDATRVIKLTQATFGGSFEGSGVMRVSARKLENETVLIEAKPESRSKSVLIVSWQHMTKPDVAGHPWGLAVSAPKIALLTFEGLYIADVGKVDPPTALKKLLFVKKTAATPTEWIALTALDNRFFCLRRNDPSPDVEVAPFTLDGQPEAIPPVSLHPDLRRIAPHPKAVFDLVGFGGRIYVVVEAPFSGQNGGRRAYSVGFDWKNGKASYRPEPLLENLFGYRLVTFDQALYALNRESGLMFRFELTKAGALAPPLQAASAVQPDGTSMIRDGLIVPVGRVLVVLGPTSVPSLDSLEKYDLHNVLNYQSSGSAEPNNIPQDLVYNPQKNYWARCGHDLDVKPGAVAAFREGESPRLWVVQPDLETHTLAVGSESLFARDYVLNFPTEALLPYLNKKRKFTIKHTSEVGPIEEKYRKLGITEVSSSGPREVSPLPARPQVQFDVEVGYNQANPAPVTVRAQVARRMQSRSDVDYLVEVTFSGPDLSTASSCIRRLSGADAPLGAAPFADDEVFGSRTQHSTNSIIEVPRPGRFDEHLRFVIVNASDKFRLMPNPVLVGGPTYIIEEAFLPLHNEAPDFTLKFDGRVETQGIINVNLNFALPHGIETSPIRQRQTKLIRLSTDQAQKMQILLVKMLMPGDAPLKLHGAKQPIEPMSDRPVFVCQLDYKL
jgi:hypothetical protein